MNKMIPFETVDWSNVVTTASPGASGVASYKTCDFGPFRVRVVEYSGEYKADHWCKKGHIVYVLQGEMLSELSDGRVFHLSSGMSYVVSDNVSLHRSYSQKGVKLLIVDGDFLKLKDTPNPWKL